MTLFCMVSTLLRADMSPEGRLVEEGETTVTEGTPREVPGVSDMARRPISKPFVQRRKEMAHPVPTKGFLKLHPYPMPTKGLLQRQPCCLHPLGVACTH